MLRIACREHVSHLLLKLLVERLRVGIVVFVVAARMVLRRLGELVS